MEIFLARTQGFCSGVAAAVEIVEEALRKYGSPLYVYHEIVHNTFIVNDFKKRGVVFVEDIDDVPQGSNMIFSAHGVPPLIIEKAKARKIKTIDASCPLVKKVHKQAIRFSNENTEVVLIGHKKHQEIVGTSGYIKDEFLHIVENENDIDKLGIPKDASVAYLTQTTLSVDDTKGIVDKLKNKFSNLKSSLKADICYATQLRQDAVKELSKFVDIMIVCGSPNSSNSNRLRETGQKSGVLSVIIDKADELDMNLLKDKEKVGITSGASVPRLIVEELLDRIKEEFSDVKINSFESPEKNFDFPLPKI